MTDINTKGAQTGRLSSASPNISNSPQLRNCSDCMAAPGEFHEHGCDVERCPRCGGQMISCNCIYIVNDIDVDTMEEKHPTIFNEGPTEEMHDRWDKEWGPRRVKWTGFWPGVLECREYGFWAVFGPGLLPPQVGWVGVPVGTPGATEDLNRLARECVWDLHQQRMVRVEGPSRTSSG